MKTTGFLGGRNYINGAFQYDGLGHQKFNSKNPTTGKTIGSAVISKKDDVDEAVVAAKLAQPDWKKLGMVKRAEYLWRVARIMEDEKEKIAELVCAESGKQLNEAMADVVEALHMAQYDFAVGHIGKMGIVFADEVPEKECMEILEPRGVVAAITPWNFPIAIPFWLVGLSLIYGNTVILKPSEETPLCGDEMAKLFHAAGIPKGVFQVLHGDGDVGEALVRDENVNVVLFTGSYDVGAKIKRITAEHDNKFCTIETGGKSAVIVLRDANLDMAIEAGIASAFKTAGQRCVSANRIIVERPLYNEYVKKFVDVARGLKVGDPFDGGTYYGPMINENAERKGMEFNRMAEKEGFEILLDRNDEPRPTKNGNWLRPFVYTMDAYRGGPSSYVLQNEAFSPHVAIIPTNNAEEAAFIYNDTAYGLAGSVITEDYRKAQMMRDEMKCGIWYWNLPCIGAGVRLPFGGVKRSGGLISSASGIIPAITHPKAITLNYGKRITMAQGLKTDV